MSNIEIVWQNDIVRIYRFVYAIHLSHFDPALRGWGNRERPHMPCTSKYGVYGKNSCTVMGVVGRLYHTFARVSRRHEADHKHGGHTPAEAVEPFEFPTTGTRHLVRCGSEPALFFL